MFSAASRSGGLGYSGTSKAEHRATCAAPCVQLGGPAQRVNQLIGMQTPFHDHLHLDRRRLSGGLFSGGAWLCGTDTISHRQIEAGLAGQVTKCATLADQHRMIKLYGPHSSPPLNDSVSHGCTTAQRAGAMSLPWPANALKRASGSTKLNLRHVGPGQAHLLWVPARAVPYSTRKFWLVTRQSSTTLLLVSF